jgi:hypothetical protein
MVLAQLADSDDKCDGNTPIAERQIGVDHNVIWIHSVFAISSPFALAVSAELIYKPFNVSWREGINDTN